MKNLFIIIVLFSVSSLVFGHSIFETKEGEKILVSLKKEFYGAKMGPVGVAPKLEIHPPEGGIEGLFPIQGTIDPREAILFRWRGNKIVGEKPALIFFEEGKNHTPFWVQSGQKRVSLKKEELGLKMGRQYHWYLGRMIDGKPIAQSRVYNFKILSEMESQALEQEIENLKGLKTDSEKEKVFLKAQILYRHQRIHDMVDLLTPLYKKDPTKGKKRFLFLGFAKLGRHREAQKFKD